MYNAIIKIPELKEMRCGHANIPALRESGDPECGGGRADKGHGGRGRGGRGLLGGALVLRPSEAGCIHRGVLRSGAGRAHHPLHLWNAPAAAGAAQCHALFYIRGGFLYAAAVGC